MDNQHQDKLSHLTEKEIENLIKRYYNGEKNNILIDEYEIDIRSALLVKTFPPKTHVDKLCPFCTITMFSYRESKSSSSKETIFCKECKHELNSSYCPCKICKDNRLKKEQLAKEKIQSLQQIQREIILDEYRTEKEYSIDITELDIQMKLYLSALLRAIAQNWDISKYGRDYNYPQSIVSEIFFDRVLKIGNRGFNSIANKYFDNNEIENINLPII